jgi:hypothetical protein
MGCEDSRCNGNYKKWIILEETGFYLFVISQKW